MHANIAAGATLFLLPAPVACFERASYSQHQSFHLEDATSSLLLLDWFTSGRVSRGESWIFERFRSCNEIHIAQRRQINDVLLLEGKTIAQRMGDYSCYCNLFICGPVLQPLLDHFRRLTDELVQYKRSQSDALIWSFSELQAGQSGIIRCAAREPEGVKDWLAAQLLCIQPIIGSDMYRAAFV